MVYIVKRSQNCFRMVRIHHPERGHLLFLMQSVHSISSLPFLLCAMLSHLSGITVKLQGSTIDILQAFSEIQSIEDNYKSLELT